MRIEESLSIISNFTELVILNIDESGKIKKKIINSKRGFNIVGVRNIYDIFPKEECERVEDILNMGIEEKNYIRLKRDYNIQDPVSVTIKKIDKEIYMCLNFYELPNESNIETRKRLIELEIAASSDPMTKLLNRYGYWERVKTLLHIDDIDRKLGILFIDVDKLKSINDTKGHKMGDKALKQISELINTSIRSRDIALRYGGDEFIIVVEELSGKKSTAYGLGKRLLRVINKDSSKYMTTISIGVHIVTVSDFQSFLSNEKRLHKEWDKAVDIADQMTYKSKDLGRNQIVSSQEI